MALTFKTQFQTLLGCGGLQKIVVVIEDKDHFWSEPATVSKSIDLFSDDQGMWEPAEINYGSGGHQSTVSNVDAVRAKAEALLRAVEIADEMDALWPQP